MKDKYIEKLAAIAYALSDSAKELNGAIEWYAAGMKSLHLDSEERAWKALDLALTIIKNDKPLVLINLDHVKAYDEKRAKDRESVVEAASS